MKNILVVVLLLIATMSFADQKAITDTGDEVFLKDNGTWEYVGNLQDSSQIKVNEIKYEKSKELTFLFKSKKNNFALWIDPKKWSIIKEKTNEDSEYEFKYTDSNILGMVINEEVLFSLEGIAKIAVETIQKHDPNMKIAKNEYRTVNGIKLIFMQLDFQFQGGSFSYLGYYYSNNYGTTQLIAYTGTNMVDKYETEIFAFLNGFTIQ